MPTAQWRREGHTGIKVPVYLWGEHSRQLAASIKDNTDIFEELVVEDP